MKLHFRPRVIGALFVFAVAWILAQHAALAATLSVTPSVVSNTYRGTITLQVGGLNNGEMVRIRKYVDANTNGLVDANDVLVQGFRLIDGVAAVIGGVTNLNVPCDYTPTNGIIVTPLDFQAGGVGQALSGQYAYVLSSPTGQFTPVTNLFNVTNASYDQSFTGTVVCSGTNVPYASVMLFTPPVDDGGMEFIAGTVANDSGQYTIPAPAATYFLLVTKEGYVADFSMSPVLPLGAGATVTTDLSLVAATRTISGRVVDYANTNQGVGALLVICESSSGLAIGFTDTNGNFTVPVTAGQWRLGSDDRQVTSYGYLRLSNQPNVLDTTDGNVSGALMMLPRFTALIYGSVKDEQNQPLAGIGLYGNQDNGSGPYESDATTDQNGNYTLGVVAGTWQASVEENRPAWPNYIFSRMDNTNISAGQAVLHNFVGIVATNHLTGFVRDGGGNPIAALGVYARTYVNSTPFDVHVSTDASGTYSLNVANGTWYVGLDCNHLTLLGLMCPSEKSTDILNGHAVVNFLVSDLQITTTSLPDATTGVFYNHSLSANGGQAPYTWSLSPGWTNLPYGLTLATNGVLSGTPTGFGSTFFGVRVTDNLGSSADQFLNLNINPAPLQITTTSLPAGTNGWFYYQTLEVTGGLPPYNWYLPGGSMTLPSGLSLSTNGVLAGAPSTNGTFNLSVAVWVNNPYQVATQQLALTIAAAPLQVTTTSPLPDATPGAFYSTTLSAFGGQTPYHWSLAPGSASLPPGLSLGAEGVISGTPSSSGAFSFNVRVMDAALTTVDWFLALTVNATNGYPTVTLGGPTQPGSGQLRFGFNTSPGWNYTIQSSSNLTTWTSVVTLGGSGAPITFTDPNATARQGFYRVKVEP